MALGAARGNVRDIVICMLALCALRVVTGVTGIGACTGRMAGGAHTISTLMVNIEAVIKGRSAPRIGIVTL